MKIKNQSSKRSHKRDGIGVRRIRTFPFLPTPLTTPSFTFRLWSSENQIVGVGSRSGRINQSQCSFPRFVIGLVLPFVLPTPTIRFSLDHRRNVSDGVVSGIGTLFSLDNKLYDSDSDSVASEKQPLRVAIIFLFFCLLRKSFLWLGKFDDLIVAFVCVQVYLKTICKLSLKIQALTW